MARERRWKLRGSTRGAPGLQESVTVLVDGGPVVPYGRQLETMPVEDHEQRVRELEEEACDIEAKWLDAERLCGIACEERDAAEAEAKAAEHLLAEAVEEFEKRIDQAKDERRRLREKHGEYAWLAEHKEFGRLLAYEFAVAYLKDKLSTLTQQQGGERSVEAGEQACGWCLGEGAITDPTGKLGADCPRCNGSAYLITAGQQHSPKDGGGCE